MTGFSLISVWIATQVTFTELLNASTALNRGSRRYGWESIALGTIFAFCDLGFIGAGLYLGAQRLPAGSISTIAILLLFFGGAFLANKSFLEYKTEQKPVEPTPFGPKISSLPITTRGFACGFWSLMADGLAILAVWLAISLMQSWRTGTLGVFFGMSAAAFLALQTNTFALAKHAKPSAFYSFSAGVVMAYGLYFFDLAVHNFH